MPENDPTLLARADEHMTKFPHHDLVAKLAARVRELETRAQERTILIAAIASALGDPGTPTRVQAVLRAALDFTLGKDSA